MEGSRPVPFNSLENDMSDFRRVLVGTATRIGVLCLLFAAPGCGRSTGGTGPVAPPDTLRIVSYNIHHGAGMDDAIDLDRIVSRVTQLNPDFVALQEVDQGVERTGRVMQADELGRLTGLSSVFGAFMAYQGGEYGMAVLSRWPIVDTRNIRLPPGEEPRSSLSVRVRSPESGRELVFTGVHFYRTEEERLAQARATVDSLDLDGAVAILAGDFNSEPGTAVMQMLQREWTIVDKGDDRLTFPSYGPEREIDFMLLRPANRFRVLRARVLDEPVISDHRPIFAEIVLTDAASTASGQSQDRK